MGRWYEVGVLDAARVEETSELIPSRTARAAGVVADWFGREGLLVLVVCGYGAILLSLAKFLLSSDGWLGLVAGRLIARHGLPSHDTLTVVSHGRRWVDQQWLAHLTFYGLQRIGGYRLLVATVALLVIASFAAAIAVSRKRGASPRMVALVALVATVPLTVVAANVSAQAFAYVLYVVLLAMVTDRAPLSWRRLGLLLLIIAVWSNLHGSAVLAAGLVALRGLVDGVDSLRARRGLRAQHLATVVLPWLALLCSPYSTQLPHYYASTVLNASFGHYLAIWQASTLSIYSLPLYMLVFCLVWLIGRTRETYSRFEKLAIFVMVALALLALRNWVWLTLVAIVLAPRGLDAVRASRGAKPFRDSARANLYVGAASAVLFPLIAMAQLAHPQSWFTAKYPDAAGRAIVRVVSAKPDAKVYASEVYADWLLWRYPQLAGHVAVDARFELLRGNELEKIALFRSSGAGMAEIRKNYDVLMFDRTFDKKAVEALGPKPRFLYRGEHAVVVAG
jgi:hypothetical protein